MFLLFLFLGISNEMTVTWSSQLFANQSAVEYSLWNETFNRMVDAHVSEFIDSSSQHRVLYMYRAYLQNLIMNTSYSKKYVDRLCMYNYRDHVF
jgi:hypothetical protein